MSKHENILDLSEKSRLSADITLLMLRGAGYAAVFCLAIWFFVTAIAMIGKALPDESRDTPDPINRSSMMIAVSADSYT